MNANGIMGYMVIIGYLFLIALAILWFFLPFAIFGIKDRLNELIAEARKTNAHLTILRSKIAASKRGESDEPAERSSIPE